ncbi:MAG TPA: UDP-N-acetylmuramate--L-alanine ligase [Gemmatimonadaceae bacterium]|nr:UDP-N-acetylmuramate--L-alanine ligase [Gemmatimonadaceae bacterium]
MSLIDNSDRRAVHFVGIAGAGMRALAELLARRGVTVTGCDANPGAVDDLEALGIHVAVGHDPAHLTGVRDVVVTSAMSKQHPEVLRAHELGIPVTRRAEALGSAVSGGRLVGIAGTHGKTTTTVMTTSALSAAGLRPTGVAGGRVAGWGGNLHYDSDELFVVEADEYDRSFLTLSPTVAVVTNMEADHLDIYRDLNDIRDTFARFVRSAPVIVLCADDAGARSLPLPASSEVIRYGLSSPDARLVARDIRSSGHATTFSVSYDDRALGQVELRVPGEHNVQNSLAAIGAGLGLGTTLDAMIPGLAAFGGVERRFQHLCDVCGVTIIDDYAHHPTEIAATLQAARASYPGRRVVVAFQPHLFTRTRDFCEAFADALAAADTVFLADIYPAREQPIAGISSDLIARPLDRSGRPVKWQGPRSDLASALVEAVSDGDVVITIGAGDITRTGPELRQKLLAAKP